MSSRGGALRPRRWRWTYFRVGVLTLMVAVVALRAYSVSRWSWAQDDWVFMTRSESMNFWDYLFRPHDGHVMPGGFVLSSLVTSAAPMSRGVVVGVTAVLSCASLAVWALAFRALMGERARLLIPLTVLALTPVATRPIMWWASALQAIPLQFFTGFCVLFAARFAQRRDRSSLMWLLIGYVGGLFFTEKAVLILIPVVGVFAFLARDGWRDWARRSWVALGALAATTVIYALAYIQLTQPSSEQGARAGVSVSNWLGLGVAYRLYRDAAKNTLIPAAFGGPWGWTPTSDNALAGPGLLTVVVSTVSFFLILAIATYLRRRAWVPVLMVTGYAFVASSLVLFSDRFQFLGDLAIRAERYLVDVVAVGCLGAAMLACPALSEPETRAFPRGLPAWMRSPRTGVAVGLMLVTSLGVGNALVIVRNGVHPGKSWFSNARSDINRLAPVSVLDADVLSISQPLYGKTRRLSEMFSPLSSRVAFDSPAETIYVIGPDGRLRPSVIADNTHALPGPVKDCGYAVEPGKRITIPMSQELFGWRWGLELTAFTASHGTLSVHVGGRNVDIDVRRGLQRRQAVFDGPVTDLELSLAADAQTICVTELTIGEISGPVDRQEVVD